MRRARPGLKFGGRRALLLVGAAVLLLAGILTLAAGEFVREQLIRPLLFLFQLAGLYLRAIPQFGLWAVLLLLLVLFGLYSVHGLRLTGAQAKPQGGQPPLATAGPLAELAERIELARRGKYFEWRLRRELRELLVELLAWRRGLSPEEALRLIRRGDWPGPAEPRLREFFRIQGPERRRPFSLTWRWPRRPRGQEQEEGFERELVAAVRYLEQLAARPEEGGDGA